MMKMAIRRLAIMIAIACSMRYFYWRAMHTMNPTARVFFYAFLVAEALAFLESLFFYFIAWNPTHHTRPAPLMGRTVDVFIPTYNEPVALLRETVLCAVNVRYPHKTYVLDDGNRAEVRALAEEFGCGYIARADRRHAKAGNLNNALKQTSGEFIVTLDADHVASPELIEETIGFFADPSVAIVQGTQDFYNMDSFQHLVNWKTRAGWQQQELFFSVIQPGKDRHNAAFYCGSPGVLRRAALEEIGGFPTETVTEDMHTSLRLQKKQWRVRYYNRTLARGLAPQTFTGFATQWQRWGQGSMQVLKTEKVFSSRDLTIAQKICYFSSFFFYWMSWVKLFQVITPIISLFFGVFALVTDPLSYANFFLPYFCLNMACSIMLQGGVNNFLVSEYFNLLKMQVLMKSVGGFFEHGLIFKVTPKAQAAAARLSELLLPLSMAVMLGFSLVAGIIRVQHVPRWGFFFWALTVNIFWAAVFLITMAFVLWRSMQRKEERSGYRFRAHLDIPMRISWANGHGPVTVQNFARNLNRSGVSVTLEEGIVPGTDVDLELLLPQRMVLARGQVVRNHTYRVKGALKISNGIRFDQIDTSDQDEISKYLFWEIAPREGEVLRLTQASRKGEQA
jgi:cellulose synthase/poly-beta-1,6-N-acetylglucosamine synthase-like glycosyltransferase